MDGEEMKVAESDIDHALEAFLLGSARFRTQFLSAIGASHFDTVAGGRFVRVRVSVNSASGETDVLAEWKDESDNGLVVLIEDKLSASFQPTQGARYAARAKALAKETAVRTVLVAPRAYLAAANPQSGYFEVKLALEDVLSWMEESGLITRSDDLAVAREALRRIAAGLALGAKGLFPKLHGWLADECERRGNSLRITNNATDWVFFDHPCRRAGLEIRYRISDNITELAFTPAFRGDVLVVTKACGSLQFSSAGKTSFIRNAPPLISKNALAGEHTVADAETIVASLEELIDWWAQIGVPLEAAPSA